MWRGQNGTRAIHPSMESSLDGWILLSSSLSCHRRLTSIPSAADPQIGDIARRLQSRSYYPTAIANQMTALLLQPEPNLRLRRWTEGCVTWTIVSGPRTWMEPSFLTARTCSLDRRAVIHLGFMSHKSSDICHAVWQDKDHHPCCLHRHSKGQKFTFWHLRRQSTKLLGLSLPDRFPLSNAKTGAPGNPSSSLCLQNQSVEL